MSPGRRQNKNDRRRSKPADLWRAMPEPPEPDDIAPATDPTALLRSLGDPPLHGQRSTAGHYLAAVVERSAGLATALAAAADLLATEGDAAADDEEVDA